MINEIKTGGKKEKNKNFFEQLNTSISLFPVRSYENGTISPFAICWEGRAANLVPFSTRQEKC